MQIREICLPATTNGKREQIVEPEAEKANLTGSETILLVDDDDAVRDIATRILKKLNYTVYAAERPEIAVDIFNRHGNVDLLLTDVIMPGMNGLDLYESLARRYSSLKVIFMSGYTDMIIKDRGMQALDAPFLQKPFSVDGITELVRKVLDEG